MGDVTNFQLYIYDCPKKRQQRRTLKIIEAYGLTRDWALSPAADEYRRLELGQLYSDQAADGETPNGLGPELQKAAPDATFICWTNPAFYWLGAVYAYAPDLGPFKADCDAEGYA